MIDANYIDCSHYQITTAQARTLCGDFGLPRPGRARIIEPATLGNVRLMHWWSYDAGTQESKAKAIHAKTAEVLRTIVKGKQVWALHLYFRT